MLNQDLQQFKIEIEALASREDFSTIKSITQTCVQQLKSALEADTRRQVNHHYQVFVNAAYRLKILAEYDNMAYEYLVRIKRQLSPSWYEVVDRSKIIKNIDFRVRDFEVLVASHQRYND